MKKQTTVVTRAARWTLGPFSNWMAYTAGNRWLARLLGYMSRKDMLRIFFVDTSIGKSVLTVQIGGCIARGVSFEPLELTVESQKVFYLDFEMSEDQFTDRFLPVSEDANCYTKG